VSASPTPASVLLLVLVAPLLEETVFRLGLHAWLLQRWGGAVSRLRAWPSRANVVVALCFGAAHLLRLEPAMAAATLVPALFVGQLYESTGRLWPCVVTHALFNAGWLLWQAMWSA
jgi:uncharacterized protein